MFKVQSPRRKERDAKRLSIHLIRLSCLKQSVNKGDWEAPGFLFCSVFKSLTS